MGPGNSAQKVELQELPMPPSDARLSSKFAREEAAIPPSGEAHDGFSQLLRPQSNGTNCRPPEDAIEILQKWNFPHSNTARISAIFWSLMVMGANDASYGAIIPHLGKHYDLPYSFTSLIFLAPFIGHTLSAALNTSLHESVGQRGIAIIGSGCHLAAFVAISFHPPYPALVFIYMLAGLGNGIGDAAWNSWVASNLADSNVIINIMHACYGLGAILGPVTATVMVTKSEFPWFFFYFFMAGLAGVELIATTTTFWSAAGRAYREANPKGPEPRESIVHETLFKLPSARVTWLCAIFALGYVGLEVSLGGWIVTFMLQVRHGEEFASGMTATGFWAGLAAGRIALGFVTPRVGERFAVMAYLGAAVCLQLLFWLIPQFFISAITVSLQGFFLGPLFPAIMVAVTKLLPRHLHVSAIGSSITSMAALPVFSTSAPTVQLSEILDSSLDAKLGRELCRTPANLTRVVYIPRHRDNTVHLPLYDVSQTYFDAVKKEPIGGSKYKLNLATMKRPSGDGTDFEVRYLVDFQRGSGSTDVLVQRRLPGRNGEMVSLTLPREGDGSFQVTPLNTGSTSRLSLSTSFPIADTKLVDRPVKHPWFTVSHQTDDSTEAEPSGLEWQTRPIEHGSLRYTLVDSGADPATAEPVVHGIYHHAGIAFGLPYDYSEGVLLLSEDLNGEAETLAVATLLGLLQQVRHINQPAPRPKKKSLIKRVLGKI
ncbi:major facilitator superfamily transporter [Colletotrichum karsti]|uniref:Major facilitator superfamily transporter n=1 Tax=Colletotrichum karsti TaxID=1095194 RepID=A0A9P6HTW4_9PEZI|nr:major facilitator superfamily transporter [Colletotrichum karsti]KAF9871043.1 major facilitator superfamily transporter [Colletotrichum karsti]